MVEWSAAKLGGEWLDILQYGKYVLYNLRVSYPSQDVCSFVSRTIGVPHAIRDMIETINAVLCKSHVT